MRALESNTLAIALKRNKEFWEECKPVPDGDVCYLVKLSKCRTFKAFLLNTSTILKPRDKRHILTQVLLQCPCGDNEIFACGYLEETEVWGKARKETMNMHLGMEMEKKLKDAVSELVEISENTKKWVDSLVQGNNKYTKSRTAIMRQ